GLSGSYQDAALPRAQRKDMAWCDELIGLALGAGGQAHRVRSVRGADAGGDAMARLDAHRERRAEARLRSTGCGHHGKTKLLDVLLGERQADETSSVHRHEVHGVRSDELAGHREIAF